MPSQVGVLTCCNMSRRHLTSCHQPLHLTPPHLNTLLDFLASLRNSPQPGNQVEVTCADLPTWQHGLAPGRSGLVADSKPWHRSGGSLVAVWSSSWEAVPDCLPDCLPDPFPDPSLEQLLGSSSRLPPDPIPGTSSWRGLEAHFSRFPRIPGKPCSRTLQSTNFVKK